MKEISRVSIPFKGKAGIETPRSLCWQNGALIDWVNGIARFNLDGSTEGRRVNFGSRFDNAIVSPNGEYVAMYERLGTKGLLLKNGVLLRELNRSYYCAEAYEYPITFLTLPNGKTALAHCPQEYCVLEIEDADSGKILTARSSKPQDFFHSRLSVSSDNRYLASSGWIWHPFEEVQVYDIEEALRNPESLDEWKPRLGRWGVTINLAVLHGPSHLFFTTADDDYDETDTDEEGRELRLPPGLIAVYDLDAQKMLKQAPLQEKTGVLLPVDENYVIDCYQHPKLIDLNTGEIVAHWEEFDSGVQDSCIIRDFGNILPLALDAKSKRLAIATKEEIVVIQLG